MKCIIIDDEQLARELVKSYVEKIPFLSLEKVCKNALEALDYLQEHEVELIITDIQMPDLLGTDFVRSLKNSPLVIFTTAYSDYAIQGFELEAVDYLLKPFSFDRFLKSVQKANELDILRHNKIEASEPKPTYITIKADHKLYKVLFSEIKYIEGMREYVSFYITDKRITALMSLKSLEKILPNDSFMRCHKSFIVNKTMVSALDGGQLVLEEKRIPIGQSYKDQVLEEIF